MTVDSETKRILAEAFAYDDKVQADLRRREWEQRERSSPPLIYKTTVTPRPMPKAAPQAFSPLQVKVIGAALAQALDGEREHLRNEIAKLRTEMLARPIIPGPPGPPGRDGKDGRSIIGPPGKDGTVVYAERGSVVDLPGPWLTKRRDDAA
jgi:hypothetical protein